MATLKRLRFGSEERFLVIALAALGAIGLVFWLVPGWTGGVQSFWETTIRFSLGNGYWGAALFAFLSNNTIVIPVPYTLALIFFGATGLNPYLLGAAAGLGAAIGEMTAYLVGRGGSVLVKDKHRKSLDMFRHIITRRPKIMPFIIFLFGVSPLPDDIVLIPLGLVRYGFWRSILPMAAGKIILTTAFAFLGTASTQTIESIVYHEQGFLAGAWSIVGAVIAVYVIMKIKWERIAERTLKDLGKEE